MKKPRSDSDPRWEELLRQACADAGPPASLPALLRVVREAPLTSRAEWAAEFAAFFVSGRAVSACLVGAGVFASLTTWEVWDCWRTLAWAQLIVATTGGAP
jgi:hypothetical protein